MQQNRILLTAIGVGIVIIWPIVVAGCSGITPSAWNSEDESPEMLRVKGFIVVVTRPTATEDKKVRLAASSDIGRKIVKVLSAVRSRIKLGPDKRVQDFKVEPDFHLRGLDSSGSTVDGTGFSYDFTSHALFAGEGVYYVAAELARELSEIANAVGDDRSDSERAGAP